MTHKHHPQLSDDDCRFLAELLLRVVRQVPQGPDTRATMRYLLDLSEKFTLAPREPEKDTHE